MWASRIGVALGVAGALPLVTGCAVVGVAGAVVGTAVSVSGTVVETGVKVTGTVAGKAVDAITPRAK